MARTQSAPAGALQLAGGWIAVSVVAEASAVALAALTFATTALGVLDAALLEGLLLGLGQRFVLRALGRHPAGGWVLATLLGAIVGRLAEFGADRSTLAATVGAWAPGAQYGAGAALGLVIGALMALPQTFVLRRTTRGTWRWIAARAVAWGIALPLLGLTGSLATSAAAGDVVPNVVGLVAGVAAIAGAIEGLTMARLTAR